MPHVRKNGQKYVGWIFESPLISLIVFIAFFIVLALVLHHIFDPAFDVVSSFIQQSEEVQYFYK
jgi:hypothetical protein